jgi:UDP-N-acetylmuramoyl-tripeptide--D-alanyl-D-alanine ligase
MESLLSVGMMRTLFSHVWKPQHTNCAMMYTAKQFGIDLFLFRPEDVDLKTRTINGLFLVGNQKVRKRVPFPAIIDNKIFSSKEVEPILYELAKDSVLIRQSLNTTKLSTHNRLMEDGRFKHLLIPTEKVESAAAVIAALREHENIVIKPASSGRGDGVRRLSQQGDVYFLTENNDTRPFDRLALEEYLQDLVGREAIYIWQPYIVSRTRAGNPFDIRIHARRGRQGKFQIHLFPRIGSAEGIVSNISSGGYTMDTDLFLRLEFGDLWPKVKQDLLDLGAVFPDYYQSLYKPVIFDVGMDIGIQKRNGSYSLHMFEVNTYIDGPFFEIEDAITHFEYFRYLEAQIIRKKGPLLRAEKSERVVLEGASGGGANLKLSIIIPHYNRISLLMECFDSILANGYSQDNYEVIVVDDGSSDNIDAVVNYSKIKNYRVYRLGINSGGASVPRNFGICRAKGEYILFVDSDDHVSEGALEKSINIAHEENCDLVIIKKISKRSAVNSYKVLENDITKINIHDAEHGSPDLEGFIYGDSYVTGRLMRRDIINRFGIKFPEDIKVNEDVCFCRLFWAVINTVGICASETYFVSERQADGLSRSGMPREAAYRLLGYFFKNIFSMPDEFVSFDKKVRIFNGRVEASHMSRLLEKQHYVYLLKEIYGKYLLAIGMSPNLTAKGRQFVDAVLQSNIKM